MFGILFGLIFVKERKDLADHYRHGIIAQILGDAHQADVMFAQPADIELQGKVIPSKPAEAVNDNHLKRPIAGCGDLQHLLELGAVLIGAGLAWINKLAGHLPALGLTESGELSALIGDR